MTVDVAEHCQKLVLEGAAAVEGELGYPLALDLLLNFEGNACKLIWVTQLYEAKSCPLVLKVAWA